MASARDDATGLGAAGASRFQARNEADVARYDLVLKWTEILKQKMEVAR